MTLWNDPVIPWDGSGVNWDDSAENIEGMLDISVQSQGQMQTWSEAQGKIEVSVR